MNAGQQVETRPAYDATVLPFLLNSLFLPMLSRFTRFQIFDKYEEMMRVETLNGNELLNIQAAKLEDIIRYASRKVPFYRDRLHNTTKIMETIGDTSRPLPFAPTTKEDIMSHFPEGITAESEDRSGWTSVSSSGTFRQVMSMRDQQKQNLVWATGLRNDSLAGGHRLGRRWMEIRPQICSDSCGSENSGTHGSLIPHHLMRSLFSRNGKSLRQNLFQYFFNFRDKFLRRIRMPPFGPEGTNIPDVQIEEYISAIHRSRPYLLTALPAYLHIISKYLKRRGGPPVSVPVIRPFGGSLTPLMRREIESALDGAVFDTYGCSEIGVLACECDQRDGLHVFMDLYHIEICRKGRLAEPGELGKIYVTDLENRVMPMIRYDIGDIGRWLSNNHSCARGSRRISIEGRAEDALVNSKGELISSDSVYDFFHSFDEIDNFQLIEESRGYFTLLCVPAEGTTINEIKVMTAFRRFYNDDAELLFYTVKSIIAEESGKFRFVKSKSFNAI